ncbi:MAG: DNA mismatch repair protein MutT [Candidatus Epulonipiscioides saccharophilum]|nr:MAG: DNA mismatch repair protein MutT [Epulopiscium sp. AS2M-Bin001]
MKIIELKELVQTKYLSMYDIVYQNKTQQNKSWMLATRKKRDKLENIFFNHSVDDADAVVIVALHKDSRSIVAIKQFRLPVNDYIYELPAGLIDNGESISTTSVRELKEETGLTVEKFIPELCNDKLYLTPGMSDESVALVFCTCSGELSTDYLEPDEDITPYLIGKSLAKQILRDGTKLDIKAFIILSNFVAGFYDSYL